MTSSLATSDQALDGAAGSAGFQEGFRTYLPLYNDYTGSSLSLETDIQRPYDSLREIDFTRLSVVAERCARIGDDFEELLQDVDTRVGTVSGWTGDAANAFRGYVLQFQAAAQTIEEDLEAIATTTGDAVAAARQVISEYVDAIGDLDFTGFDSPDDIQFMIEVERMLKLAGDVINAVHDWLGDLIGVSLPMPGGGVFGSVTGFVADRLGDAADLILDSLGMSVDGFLEWIAGKVREYLDASFTEPFETNLQLLDDTVDAARTGIQDAFRPVITAAAAVTEAPFTSLPAPPGPPPSQPSPATEGAAAAGFPLDEPIGGVPGAPAAGGTPGITAWYGDMTVTVSTGGDGDGMQLTLTDGDGGSTRYAIRVDEGGVPDLVPVDKTGGPPDEPVQHTVPDPMAHAFPVTPELRATAELPVTNELSAADEPWPTPELPVAHEFPAAGGLLGGSNAATPVDGEPPAVTVATGVGVAATDDPVTGEISGGPTFQLAGEVSGGDPGPWPTEHPEHGHSGVGQVTYGEISGHDGAPDPGTAQLASAADAPTAAGGAQLASVGDHPEAGQHGTAGTTAPMMPVAAGTISGGDGERRGGAPWQVPGDILEPEEPAAQVTGLIGEHR